ncbi:hypothetical protein GGR57DRAFT_499495 [Xylariaceae sp. FL1272]|nr:hypothetical protein GGR57DRAFT_499495 [Xylariaceae sp. FL1272]
MAPNCAISNQNTASDMMAVAKVNCDKLTTRAGFQDAATALAHYEPLLLARDRPGRCGQHAPDLAQ